MTWPHPVCHYISRQYDGNKSWFMSTSDIRSVLIYHNNLWARYKGAIFSRILRTASAAECLPHSYKWERLTSIARILCEESLERKGDGHFLPAVRRRFLFWHQKQTIRCELSKRRRSSVHGCDCKFYTGASGHADPARLRFHFEHTTITCW